MKEQRPPPNRTQIRDYHRKTPGFGKESRGTNEETIKTTRWYTIGKDMSSEN